MKSCSVLLVGLTMLFSAPAIAQIIDSSGSYGKNVSRVGDTVYSSTWERVSGKPETFPSTWEEVENKPVTATRWPTWNEIPAKPSSFPPSAHNHDDRYVRRGTNGAISGNLNVSGTVTGNRLVTGDVSGDRWCRANSSGRILCTSETPSAAKNIVKGWPYLLLCGTSDNREAVYRLIALDNKGYVYYNTAADVGGMRSHLFYEKNGDYSHYDTGDKRPHSECLKNINNVPAHRKLL